MWTQQAFDEWYGIWIAKAFALQSRDQFEASDFESGGD